MRLVGRGDWQFDALAYVQLRDFSNVVISSTSFLKTLDQRRTPSTGLGGKLELRPPVGGGHVLRLGADWRLASGELQEEAYNAAGAVTARRRAGGRNNDVGLFAQDDWTLGPVVLTAGARADRWAIDDGFFRQIAAVTTNTLFPNRSGWDTSLRGGAVWHVAPRLAVRAAGYSGLRLPTLNELYRPFVVFPVTTSANAALGNEHLVGYEGGVDWTPSAATSISLTAFDNRIENAIAHVTIALNTRERRNVDAIHARGIELSAALKLGRLSLDGSLALTDAKVEASGTSASLNGLRPAQTPKIAASATLGWRPRDGWLITATLRHVGAQFEDDLQTDILPAATTLDMFAQVPVCARVSVILRAENLSDTAIVTRNQAGSIDLGAPRTLWAGFRVKLPH